MRAMPSIGAHCLGNQRVLHGQQCFPSLPALDVLPIASAFQRMKKRYGAVTRQPGAEERQDQSTASRSGVSRSWPSPGALTPVFRERILTMR
jgi:hypothetical protein